MLYNAAISSEKVSSLRQSLRRNKIIREAPKPLVPYVQVAKRPAVRTFVVLDEDKKVFLPAADGPFS